MKFSITVTEPYSTTNLNIANHQFLILFSDFAHSKATKIHEKSALDERSYNVVYMPKDHPLYNQLKEWIDLLC